MTAKAAARGDTEQMLKIGGETGWDPETTYAAARNGHTETMLAAHEAGSPWHSDTIAVAISSGYPETAWAARGHMWRWYSRDSVKGPQ